VQCHVTLMPSAHSTSPAGCPSCFRAWHGWPTLPPSTRPLPVGCRSRYSRAGPLAAPDVRRVTQRTVVLYVGVWMVDRCRGTAPTTTRATLRPPVRRRAVVPCGKQAVGCIRYRESSQNNALILNTTVTNLMLCLLVGCFKVQSHNTQPVATCCNLLQPVATLCDTVQHRSIAQIIATHCNAVRIRYCALPPHRRLHHAVLAVTTRFVPHAVAGERAGGVAREGARVQGREMVSLARRCECRLARNGSRTGAS
jgi:hypothetical protein